MSFCWFLIFVSFFLFFEFLDVGLWDLNQSGRTAITKKTNRNHTNKNKRTKQRKNEPERKVPLAILYIYNVLMFILLT